MPTNQFAKTYGGEPFSFGKHTIKADFETLPGEAEELVEDFVRAERYSHARIQVLSGALTRLEVDGQVLFKNNKRGAQRMRQGTQSQHLPSTREFFDKETKTSLTKRLQEMVVAHEFWLADLFPDCFGEFVPDAEEEQGNPTDGPAGKKKEASS